MPELWASLGAHLRGSPDIAVGNVLGSNIFNIGLILGISALLISIPVAQKTLRLEWPFLLLASGVGGALMFQGSIGRLAGFLFLAGLAAFLWGMIAISRRDVRAARELEADWVTDAKAGSPRRNYGFVVLGLLLLPLGAEGVVRGAVGIAGALGVSERVIGITIVALGTSLPELASSVIAAIRGQSDVAVGNVIGSNLFNTLGILGTTAMVKPIPVAAAFHGDVIWMLVFTVLLAPVLFFGRKVTRMDGLVLLALLVVYLGFLLNNQEG
jgi:cation:H+ antiporter